MLGLQGFVGTREGKGLGEVEVDPGLDWVLIKKRGWWYLEVDWARVWADGVCGLSEGVCWGLFWIKGVRVLFGL